MTYTNNRIYANLCLGKFPLTSNNPNPRYQISMKRDLKQELIKIIGNRTAADEQKLRWITNLQRGSVTFKSLYACIQKLTKKEANISKNLHTLIEGENSRQDYRRSKKERRRERFLGQLSSESPFSSSTPPLRTRSALDRLW